MEEDTRRGLLNTIRDHISATESKMERSRGGLTGKDFKKHRDNLGHLRDALDSLLEIQVG